MPKLLIVILTSPLRLLGIILAGALKLLGKFIAVLSVVFGLITAIIGVVAILAGGFAILMHCFGHLAFDGFWVSAIGVLVLGFLFVMIGRAGESIGEFLDDLGGNLFALCIS